MEAAQAENRELKLKSGSGVSDHEDDALLSNFVTNLGAVLEMRAQSKFDPGLFEQFNISLVHLSDGHVGPT